MNDMPSGDPHIEEILGRVPGKVARTFTPEQWEGVREALRQTSRLPRHLMHLRFILPFYFLRLYCIVIVGKDRRQRVEHILFERRRYASILIGALALAAIFAILVLSALAMLYIIKSASGVDLVPGAHFGDYIPGMD